MPETTRLYYDDSYTHAFSARLLESLTHDARPAVVLDQTYFYPTSGGQPNDLGTIAGVAVIDVVARKDDGAVLHVLAGALSAAVGDQVDCALDWARRFDHMQHHTGQHILSQSFVQVAQANTVGFHLSSESITIDLDRTSLSSDAVASVEALANQVVWGDRPVTVRVIAPDDAEGVRVRKLPEHLLTGGLRVVDIDGFDVTACGGTHVARTGEIGLIKILRLEKRGDKTRVEFRCGGRALSDYAEKNALANQLTADLTCALGEVAQAVSRLQENFKAEQRALKAANAQLLDYEAQRLLAEAALVNGTRVVCLNFVDRDFADVRVLASRLTAENAAVALLATSGAKAQLVFARSADLSVDMNLLLRQALAQFPDGRGGGQPQMAQGGGTGDAVLVNQTLAAALESITQSLG